TKRTCQSRLVMFAFGGKADIDRTCGHVRSRPKCMVRPCVARGFVDLADVVLHQCIRPLIGALLPAIMDISARATSLADRPQWANWVTSARTRREDRSSISSHPLADLGGLEAWVHVIACSLGGYQDSRRFEVAVIGKYAPGDARQLVGERDGEHVVV